MLQHRQYTGQLATLFSRKNSAADTTAIPAYDDINTMTATLQHLHMSELLHHDEDAVESNGPNDIDVSRMLTGGYNNNDFTIGGSAGAVAQPIYEIVALAIKQKSKALSWTTEGTSYSRNLRRW